ncbi:MULTISPECIES: GNAT family N-acetyltransferase [unclassified Streptomyces]|uniref:GNAT family N-acetyltransferase n=1 Tax=unclassified Streptomyces TaxID=2593676 RepID=UPI0006885946|nr:MULTISPECIES: GNAT family N-acetyltransferase [unclassified Streptomyces]MYT31371.1 GNAT family N-acetyltransferase [Streptomyces sp. SID8354]
MDAKTPLPPPVIDLGDLTLRRFDADTDLPEFLRVVEESREHLRPWAPWASGRSPSRTIEFLGSRAQLWDDGKDFTYAIVLNGAIVGSCGLYRHDDTPPDGCEIGYWLHPAASGRGVATRAARALAAEAFRLPGVEWVEIVHDPANHASGAIPARLGFTVRCRRPAERLAPAETGEDQIWRLTRSQAARTHAIPSDGPHATPPDRSQDRPEDRLQGSR